MLAAAGLRRDVTAFVSADRALAFVGDLPYVDPATDELESRLGLA